MIGIRGYRGSANGVERDTVRTLGVVVTSERIAEVRELLARVRDWAAKQPDVAAAALVGSWAHDDARMDSDIDLVLLTDAQQSYLHDERWVAELGGLRIVKTARWGPLTERRFVLPSGLEIEVGIAPTAWATTDPVDWGTRRVVEDGMCIIYDPRELLRSLAEEATSDDGARTFTVGDYGTLESS